MKKKNVIMGIALIALALVMGISACKKKSETTQFTVSSITAGGININGATPPSNVPANAPSIIIGFNMDLNASSVTADKFSLVRNYDTASRIVAMSFCEPRS